jgi:hypothetical protein
MGSIHKCPVVQVCTAGTLLGGSLGALLGRRYVYYFHRVHFSLAFPMSLVGIGLGYTTSGIMAFTISRVFQPPKKYVTLSLE